MNLFDRNWRITVGSLRVSRPLKVAVTLARSLRPTPNRASISIWNLTRPQQSVIESARDEEVIVELGYGDNLSQAFRGTIMRASGERSTVSGVDVVTKIEARDGGQAYQRARVSRSFAPGVSAGVVFEALAESMGVGIGNAREFANHSLLGGGEQFEEGLVLRGSAAQEMTQITQSMGLRWSVQSGNLQIRIVGSADSTTALRITPNSGLVGYVEVGTRGRAKIKSLYQPGLLPGKQVQIDDGRVSGDYVVRALEVRADSHGQEWYSICDLSPITVRAQ